MASLTPTNPTKHTPSTLDTLHTRLLTCLKHQQQPSSHPLPPSRSPSSLNNAIAILTDLRDSMPHFVYDARIYSHFLKLYIPSFRDVLCNVNAVVKKKKSAAVGAAEGKEKEKKNHPLFVGPEGDGMAVRRCALEILCRCPLNEEFEGYASVVLSCCVNVLLVDYEENALLAIGLIFQIHKNCRSLSANVASTTSMSRMKGDEARQLRECQAFLDFVTDCYKELTKSGSGSSLERNFDFSSAHLGGTPVSAGDLAASKENMPLVKPKQSFRVLTECPLVATLLFQLYSKFLKTNIPTMVPFMIDSLKLVPPRFVDPSKRTEDTPAKKDNSPKEGKTPTTPAIHDAKPTKETPLSETLRHPSIDSSTPMTTTSTASTQPHESPQRLYRIRVLELLATQAKTLSFLTYLLRAFPDQMRPYEDAMTNNITCLLKNCPREAITTRKELLTSMRQILTTEFRRGFFRHLDIFLDERSMIVGSSRYSSLAEQSLRPLGYLTLADLIHHARARMTLAQLGRAVTIYSRVLHDVVMDMPLVLQVASARLFLNLVDQIYNNRDPNPQLGRDLLVKILSAYIQKFRAIKVRLSSLLEDAEKERQGRSEDGQVIDATKEFKSDEDDCEGTNKNSSPVATLRGIQSLLRMMYTGMKTIVWCVNNYGQQREKERQRALAAGEEQFPLPPSATQRENEEVNSAMLKITNGERELVSEYMIHGLPCLRAFHFVTNLSPQYLEMVELFAASFSLAESVESSNIRHSMVPNLPFIMEAMEDDTELIHLFKHLLLASGKSVSYEVCDLLFRYLVDNTAVLGDFETSENRTKQQNKEETNMSNTMHSSEETIHISTRAQNHFKLFIILFSSLAKYPKNEVTLLPHLRTFVPDCVQRSMEGNMIWPGPYLCIIRGLFRALTGGKFEASYREMVPLLPALLNGFYRIYSATLDDPLRFMIIELMLTMPSRLSTLLPHLPLQVKVIIPALQSNRGDLINLGLRTLEFWIDNLHPDYIYPVLAQDVNTLCTLMTSLTKHLQPAPYPYGLLCLRLLGKLGGTNRLFLHEAMSQDFDEDDSKMAKQGPSILFEWQEEQAKSEGQSDPVSNSFPLPLPVQRAVDVLRYVAAAPCYIANKNTTLTTQLPLDSQSEYVEALFNAHAECVDLNLYAVEIMEKTKLEQAKSAFAVIRGALASILDLNSENHKIFVPTSEVVPDECQESTPQTEDSANSFSKCNGSVCTRALKLICDGLFTAAAIKELEKEAMMLLKGLGSHVLFVIQSHISYITRIDCDGAVVDNSTQSCFEQNHLSGGKLQQLRPYGCFRFSGPLADGVDPFILNESLAYALAGSNAKHTSSPHAKKITQSASKVMEYMLELTHKIKSTFPKTEGKPRESDLAAGDIFVENLLCSLCQACFGQPWNHRTSLMTRIVQLLNKMGLQWSKQFEVEILHVAMFMVKDAPAEIQVASKQALEFFVSITWFLFDVSKLWHSSTLIYDFLSPHYTFNPIGPEMEVDSPTINQTAFTLILSEIGSTKQLVRIAVRLFLRIVSRDRMLELAIKENMAPLKRLVFPRILRNSPLPEQVAIIESMAFMMERAPSLFSIDDQTCISFTAELLKMVSVADGDINDSISSVVLIDKNGFAFTKEPSNQQMKHKMHTSSLFRRASFYLECGSFGGSILVPEELPLGVQFRVASVYLFRSIIRSFPTKFFNSDAKSQIGNLRPHVVSLLFRSLTSEAEEVASAAESTLRDALNIGDPGTEDCSEDQKKSPHKGIPKELIQACIRPILVNLKDHTKLTLPLLRGISCLLSLLTSWFNKSMGEKMIDHLCKFAEADKIIELRLWKSGDEPKVAASVISLFSLLPSSSRFIEALVKITTRLEAAWKEPISSFRDPLARYLNCNCTSAIGFFLDERRLCNPVYSALFKDIVQRRASEDLRKFISTKECTVMLLNVCFERPLAILRAEKSTSSSHVSKPSHETYGMNPAYSYSAQRKMETARRDIMVKKNQLAKLLKPDDQIESGQTVDNLKKELESARLAYSKEISEIYAQKATTAERRMTTAALELQHQGLSVISILVSLNKSYFNIQEQNDIVRALRWLWRSRGRHYRQLYEEEIQPRYFSESWMLAKFLVSFSEAHPADIDALFDLIRIFLNPTSLDFTFVKQYIHQRVTHDLSAEQREQIFQRYLSLLTSEGSEENKILCTSMMVIPMLQANDPTPTKPVLGDSSIRHLIKSLLHGSSYSSKLICQLLRLISVLLEHLHDEINEYRKDLIKYVWGILKRDDANTKYYGYLAVSRFVSAFETPAKVTLQVYRSLLRSHNTPEKAMVRSALNILVPTLPKRLSPDELEVALKYTSKVIQEEGNSAQQLAHLIECITCHPNVYSGYSSILIPQMIHALSILGGSQNSLLEFKEISIATAKLVFEWSKTKSSSGAAADSGIVEKKSTSTICQPNADAIVNFLVTIILLNAEGKADLAHCQVHVQATSLLNHVLSSHPNVNISEIHFEKFAPSGSATEQEMAPTEKTNETSKKSEKNKKLSSQKEVTPKNTDRNKSTAGTVILALLEILSILLIYNPNALSKMKPCKLIASCFSNSSLITNVKGQKLLKEFTANMVTAGHLGSDNTVLLTLLEDSIRGVSYQTHEEKMQRCYFAIDVIEKVSESYPEFTEPFISSLTYFAKEQVEKHVQETPSSRSSISAFGMYPPVTPTSFLFENACGIGLIPKSKDLPLVYEVMENRTLGEVDSLKASLRALVKSLRLISLSTALTTFSTTRKLFLEVLSILLDSSTSIPVLMTIVGIIGNMIRSDNQRKHFTLSEKEEMLSRCAHMDFSKFPLVASQVLLDMICWIVLSVFEYDQSFACQHFLEHTSYNTTTANISTGRVMNKLFPFCLMVGNEAIRSAALQIFVLKKGDAGASIHPPDSKNCDVFGIPCKCLKSVIHRFLLTDFEYIGNCMWTVILADLLLAVGNLDKGLQLYTEEGCKQGYLRLPHNLMDGNAHEIDCNTAAGDDVYSIFVKHLLLEKIETNKGRGRCISALRNILHGDVDTSQSILECAFQAVWLHLPSDEERVSLMDPLEKLLAMPYHSQFLNASQSTSSSPFNAIQSLLRLVINLRPIPMIDTFLLSSLAVDYSVYYEVLSYLEKQYLALERNGLKNSPEFSLVLRRITELYTSLGERDVTLALSSAMCSSGTKFALSLDMYGAVQKSTDAYLSLIDRADVDDKFMPSKSEVNLWTQRWIEAHKELSQWALVDELSPSLGDTNLMMESAWKTKNWDKVKSLYGSPQMIASIESGNSCAKMTEIYLAIHEGKLAEVENLHAQAAQLCLYKWQLLPSVRGCGTGAHQQLYHNFQRLVELRESSQIMIETSSHSSRRSVPDLKTVLSSWRHRNPNTFETVSVWEDLYSWRIHIFDAISKIFNWIEPSTLATLHDRPIASITLGRTARKQDLKEVSMFLLSDLTECMDVEDAFLKLREQIVSYQHSTDEAMLKGGLNLVNSTNLTFFDARQKAELFRLKSYFFNALNDKSNAHKSYCHSVQINPNYARAWIDWGHLCASLPDNTKNSTDSKEAKRKMTIQYMAQALGCYLEAVKCDASEQSRENIPYCLSMLSLDSFQYGHLFKAFEARAPLSPAWIWLPWIPQLLTCLCREEAKSVQTVLMRIVNDHPQALYYSLRAFFLERRDIERSKDNDTGSRQEDDAQKHAEILMSSLRKLHPVLWNKLEAILEDLIIRFRPSYESELLATIKALLEKAKAKVEQNQMGKDGIQDSKHVLLESLYGSLGKISVKFFNQEKPLSSKGRKTLLFEKKWREAFDHDFIQNNTPKSTTIEELIEKLERWKAKLEHHLSLVPNKCHLQETSPSLSWYVGASSDFWAGSCESASLSLSNLQHDYQFTLDNALYEATRSSTLAAHKASSDALILAAKAEGLGGHEGGGATLVEIPGQYPPTSSNALDMRPFPEMHAKLVRFHQSLEVICSRSKQDQTFRQITMIGSDGKRYRFSLQLAIPYWTRTDERSSQLQYITCKILRKDVQARRRCLVVRPNVVVPVAQRMRMSANKPSHTSLDFVVHSVKSPSTIHLVDFFEEEVAKRLADTMDESSHATEKVKLEVYQHICQELLPPNILSKYMTDTIPSIQELLQYRKVFSAQVAINSVLQHAFAVIERTASRFVFCTRTGQVLAHDFRFQYNQGLLEAHNVPFRMTRTIVDFIGPFLLEGVFIPSFVTTSSALNSKQKALEPVLHLLLRDDIISWYTSKSQPRNDKKMQDMEHQLSERVQKNINYVQTRLKECSIRPVENAAQEAVSADSQPIDAHVRNLVDAAANEKKLCLMSSVYQAWL